MSLQDRIINHFSDSIQTQQDAMTYLCELIEYASQRMVATLLNDKKLLSCGNGRSATSTQLLSSAMLSQFERDRPSLPVIALTSDTAAITNEAINKFRTVPAESEFVQIARGLGISLGD